MAEKPEEPAPPSVTFIDNPHSPELFATDFSGIFLHTGGVVTVTYESARIDHVTAPGPVNRVVVGRVSLPLESAQRLCLGLYDFLKRVGHDPSQVIQTEGDPSKPQ